jgi:hypothetical protein
MRGNIENAACIICVGLMLNGCFSGTTQPRVDDSGTQRGLSEIARAISELADAQ